MHKPVLAFSLGLLLTACGGQQDAQQPVAQAAPKPADQPTQPVPPKSVDQMFAEKLDQVVAGVWRSPGNKIRDQYRHPKQTLTFFGLKPGMSVIEITPGGGWYTEILAPLMKGSGSYSAAVFSETGISDVTQAGYIKKNNDALHAKLTGDAEHYDEAKVIQFDSKTPNLGAPNSVDMVVTFRNAHNWVGSDTAAAMFKAFFDVLKPGGVLGVTDHRANPGADLEQIKKSGYLPQEFVIKLAEDAGFKLADKSEINANPKDTKDYPKGVWTLPPTLALGEQDKDKYLAIGETDRMTLKFFKPKADEIFKQDLDTNVPVPGQDSKH